MGRFWGTVAAIGIVVVLEVVDRLFIHKERNSSVKETRHDSSHSRDVRPVQAPQHHSGVGYQQSSVSRDSRPTPQALPVQRRAGYEPESQQPHRRIVQHSPRTVTSVANHRRAGYEPDIPRGWLPTHRLSDDTPPPLFDPTLEEFPDNIPLSGYEPEIREDWLPTRRLSDDTPPALYDPELEESQDDIPLSGYEPEIPEDWLFYEFELDESLDYIPLSGYEPEIPEDWLRTRRLSEDTPPPLYDPELEESQDDTPLSADEHRAMAQKARKEMTKAFEQSKVFKRNGFWADAQSMEEKGQKFKRTMETLNQKASELIYQENNKNKKPGEVDLHRLFLKEAEQKVQEAIWAAEARGASSVRFIVGQGKHSKNGARLKPELTSFIEGLGHTVRTDGRNAGVLVVEV
ncbi:hypothetical protein R3P38DRAFT_2821488 [Favolaschia claudopus]|uniref:Smr domain-containing protein n=1 Tax=Favolaschia claudopus TaxID=2862362 RepID=A0AAW0EIP5_9AGAR